MKVLGVIPAAGEGSRWGGYYKELLPCGNQEWLLDRAIKSMRYGGADKICVITSIGKITTHASHIVERHDDVFYVIQRGKNDIWSAMAESLPFAEDVNLFAMPDTFFPLHTFNRNLQVHKYGEVTNFYIGVHNTQNPERFGVLHDGRVVNKPTDYPRGTYSAWGTLVWSKKVANFWMDNPPTSYTDAINSALAEFRWESFEMEYYKDMARWGDYQSFIGELHGEGGTKPLYTS